VSSIVNNMRENRLRLFDHVMKRENTESVRTFMEMQRCKKNRKGKAEE